ncbi:hipl1 protein [Ranunculus cassubicifolius]
MAVAVFIVCHLLLLPYLSYSLPLCTNSRTPFTLQSPLAFCSYNETACCSSAEDTQLQKQFQSMNISDPSCASAVKSILCARCDPYSAELFTSKSVPRTIPVLCNSTVSVGSTQSKDAGNDFCAKVWDTCQKVSVLNSPFAPSLQGRVGMPVNSSISQLTDLWQSKSDFCDAFGGPSSDGSVCFSGDAVTLKTTEPPSPPSGLCLEKIGNGSYLNMVAHPDGSDRVFLGNQEGKIWLATVPKEGSSEVLGLDESDPFIDLTDDVHFDTTFGMMGMAFHPDFAHNGRFFASYNCDKSQSPRCSGRCSCNSDANCDPSKLTPEEGAQPCRYHSVISEFTANGTAIDGSSVKTSASPTEVRRIFTMGLPFSGHHAGQILFGPEDGYMYFMMGDGGSRGDPYKFSQNKKSLLGKIMRLDINHIPSTKEINDLGLWGNYSIPKDNPSVEDKELQPEIWTLGMRNPWRCSFDSERPSYFLCADVGQETYEEVDLITKGGNYGWSVYEGHSLYQSTNSTTTNTSLISSDTIFPVLGYSHTEVNKNEGSASITGGYIYRSTTDPCMQGRYLYADLYAHYLWAADEFPKNSGNFNSTLIPFSCAADSPIQCTSVQGSALPNLGYIYSFGEDNRKDVMLLTSSGVYRVVRPSRCNYSCSKENATASSPGSSPAPSSANRIRSFKELVLLFSCFLLVLPVFFM